MKRLSLTIFSIICSLAGTAGAATSKTSKSSNGSKPDVPVRKAIAVDPSASRKKLPVEVFAVDPDGRPPQIQAGSAILLDADTGAVLREINADLQRPVASTQKLMTALLVAEAGNLGEDVEVKASDTWAEPSKLDIQAGDVYPRQKLLQILLVKSMNDVARCLARDNAGSIEAFADRMNQKAELLGMSRSHYVNPNGLPDPSQFSTARDMSKLALAAYRNRTIRSIVCLKALMWRYPNGKVHEFENTNRVLKKYALCNGMKTGYTEAAGFCLISSASNGGREVISVVLGDKRDAIWTDSYRLLAWGLRQ